MEQKKDFGRTLADSVNITVGGRDFERAYSAAIAISESANITVRGTLDALQDAVTRLQKLGAKIDQVSARIAIAGRPKTQRPG